MLNKSISLVDKYYVQIHLVLVLVVSFSFYFMQKSIKADEEVSQCVKMEGKINTNNCRSKYHVPLLFNRRG